jgi:hypothetical protein
VTNPQGSLQTLATIITEQTWNLELTFQFFDWGVLQLSFGEIESTTASIKLAKGKSATVPTAPGPYEVTDADLAGLAVTDLTVAFISTDSSQYEPLEVLATGTPTASQVTLDNSGNTLTFDSTNAGRSFAYYPKLTYTSKKTLGVESAATTLGNVNFDGAVVMASSPQEIMVNIPSMGRTGGFTFEVGAENTVTFKPIQSGSNASPVRFLNPS